MKNTVSGIFRLDTADKRSEKLKALAMDSIMKQSGKTGVREKGETEPQ